MKKYVVEAYDKAAVYTIEAGGKDEAEKKAVEMYQKEKDTWLWPHSVEVVDEIDVENM